ncbi:hypothetical protein EKO04_004741 [Ascochyta lentis]|uniref:Uncharacterized protein n=1 Tax=Ascochyta lentis TaxID=205686 RepID=A0A8H7J6E7_9PLEO|nr:hypothetical protein EKO04_004741 [Ascochyta lentis]
MVSSLVMVAAVAGTASAQSATALTFWMPGPAMNPSIYSKQGFGLTTYPPVASILSSDTATTVFTLGCPSPVPATQSRIQDGSTFLTCNWATHSATYTLINSTRHIMHETQTAPDASQWWSCDYNTAATQLTCGFEILGDVNDNTGGPITDWVIPDERGNVVAFATAQVVAQGRFGELQCGVGYRSRSALPCNSDGTGGKPTAGASASASAQSGLVVETESQPRPTATQGSGVRSGESSRTASATVATASAGAAARYGVEGVALVVLAGAAMLNV